MSQSCRFGHQALLGDGCEAVWGSRTEGGSQQAGGEGPELRGMGEAALTPLRPPTKEQLHPPDAGPPTPVCGETTRLQSPWAHDGRTSEGPCDLTCAWWPSGQTPSPCPSTSSEEGGRGPGPARGGSPGRAWPLHPPGPVAHLLGGHGGRAPLPMVPARCRCSLCQGGRPGWPWALFWL